MKTLRDVIDYASAPLVQWEPAIADPLSPGKKHEDRLTHGAVAVILSEIGARQITGIIADEARMELEIASQLPLVKKVTHLTLSGAFEKAAQYNVDEAVQNGALGADSVRVVTNIKSIKVNSQDAVIMNMILGCLATSQDHQNVHRMLCFAATLLKPQGKLVLVRPNPEGGKFSTYQCTTPADDLKGGADYAFIVNGLEDLGEMKNLYTPDDFLRRHMEKAGFDLGVTHHIHDPLSEKSPFLLNVNTLRP